MCCLVVDIDVGTRKLKYGIFACFHLISVLLFFRVGWDLLIVVLCVVCWYGKQIPAPLM